MNTKRSINIIFVLCTFLSQGVLAQTVTLEQAVEYALKNDPVLGQINATVATLRAGGL